MLQKVSDCESNPDGTMKAEHNFGLVLRQHLGSGWYVVEQNAQTVVRQRCTKCTWVAVAQSMLCGSDSFQQHRPVLLSSQTLCTLLFCKGKEIRVFRKSILSFIPYSKTKTLHLEKTTDLSRHHLKMQLKGELAVSANGVSLD